MTGVGAAIAGGLAALVVAVLAGRYPGALTRAIERVGHAGYALPGIIVALALVFFATRAVPVALPDPRDADLRAHVHYLPLAIGPIGASLRQVSPRVEEAARGLGRRPDRGLSHDHRAARARRDPRRRRARLPARDQGAPGYADPGPDRLQDLGDRDLEPDQLRLLRGERDPGADPARGRRRRRSTCSPSAGRSHA